MSEITNDSFLSVFYRYLGYFVLFFLVLWVFSTYFVPYYKTHLKEKLREWIVAYHLDPSGQQIQNNRTYSNDFLIGIELTESVFSL